MQAEPGESSSSKKYATPEDWPKLQDVIVRLYVEENKTLEEVRQYMEENHDFVATYGKPQADPAVENFADSSKHIYVQETAGLLERLQESTLRRSLTDPSLKETTGSRA